MNDVNTRVLLASAVEEGSPAIIAYHRSQFPFLLFGPIVYGWRPLRIARSGNASRETLFSTWPVALFGVS